MGDSIAQKLLVMSEYFRSRANIRSAVKCALAAVNTSSSPCFKIHATFFTGKLYHLHTLQTDEATNYLEHVHMHCSSTAAMEDGHSMYERMRETRLEAAIYLSELYIAGGQPHRVYEQFKGDLSDARTSGVGKRFLSRLGFLCAEALMLDRNIERAIHILDMLYGAANNDKATELYILVTRLLVQTHIFNQLPGAEVENLTSQIDQLLPPESDHHNNLHSFLMAVQLAYFIQNGMVRTSKALLRKMQSLNVHKIPREGLRWADGTYITTLTCLLTQLTCTQHCTFDRSLKYYQYAVKHVQEYMVKAGRSLDSSVHIAMRRLKMVADETMVQSNIVAYDLTKAMDMIMDMREACLQMPGLRMEWFPKIHLLVGIVAKYLEYEGAAVDQFNAAAKCLPSVPPGHANFDPLAVIVDCHLALHYLHEGKYTEFYDYIEKIPLVRAGEWPAPIRTMMIFVHALYAFIGDKAGDCKNRISEVLDLTRSEDMFRMHTMAILLCSGLTQQVTNIVETLRPTMDWSTKGRDVGLLIWTNVQMLNTYEMSGMVDEGNAIQGTATDLLNKIYIAQTEFKQYPHRDYVTDLQISSYENGNSFN